MTEFTITDAAKILGRSERTVRRYIHDGKLSARLDDRKPRGQYQIAEADLFSFQNAPGVPSYDELKAENAALRRELLRLINRVEAGAANAGDITRARGALGDGGE